MVVVVVGTCRHRQVSWAASSSREDGLSCTSDYSTTSSSLAAGQGHVGLLAVSVPSGTGEGVPSDYGSSDPSPCCRADSAGKVRQRLGDGA